MEPLFTGAIDGSFAGDFEIRQALSVDEGRGPLLFSAFLAGVDHGVIVNVRCAFEHAVFFDEKSGALLEEDGAAEERAFGNHNYAASGCGALIDGGLDGLGVDRVGIGDGAEVGDDE